MVKLKHVESVIGERALRVMDQFSNEIMYVDGVYYDASPEFSDEELMELKVLSVEATDRFYGVDDIEKLGVNVVVQV